MSDYDQALKERDEALAEVERSNEGFDQMMRQRDEAREAAREIVFSIGLIVTDEARKKLWKRMIERWPWIGEPE